MFRPNLDGATSWIRTAAKVTGDPIRDVKDVKRALLILDGANDARASVGQGIGFYRGLKRMSK